MRRSAGPLDDRSRAGRATGTILATAPANWTRPFRISPDRVTTPRAPTRTPHRPADAVSAVCRPPGRRGSGPRPRVPHPWTAAPSPPESPTTPTPPRRWRRPTQRGAGDRAPSGLHVPTVPWRVAVAGGATRAVCAEALAGRAGEEADRRQGNGEARKPPPRAAPAGGLACRGWARRWGTAQGGAAPSVATAATDPSRHSACAPGPGRGDGAQPELGAPLRGHGGARRAAPCPGPKRNQWAQPESGRPHAWPPRRPAPAGRRLGRRGGVQARRWGAPRCGVRPIAVVAAKAGQAPRRVAPVRLAAADTAASRDVAISSAVSVRSGARKRSA